MSPELDEPHAVYGGYDFDLHSVVRPCAEIKGHNCAGVDAGVKRKSKTLIGRLKSLWLAKKPTNQRCAESLTEWPVRSVSRANLPPNTYRQLTSTSTTIVCVHYEEFRGHPSIRAQTVHTFHGAAREAAARRE